jgi:hypothetical protein
MTADPALLSALADAIRNAGATEEIVTGGPGRWQRVMLKPYPPPGKPRPFSALFYVSHHAGSNPVSLAISSVRE